MRICPHRKTTPPPLPPQLFSVSYPGHFSIEFHLVSVVCSRVHVFFFFCVYASISSPQMFEELADYRAFELLRSHSARSDYLLTKQVGCCSRHLQCADIAISKDFR